MLPTYHLGLQIFVICLVDRSMTCWVNNTIAYFCLYTSRFLIFWQVWNTWVRLKKNCMVPKWQNIKETASSNGKNIGRENPLVSDSSPFRWKARPLALNTSTIVNDNQTKGRYDFFKYHANIRLSQNSLHQAKSWVFGTDFSSTQVFGKAELLTAIIWSLPQAVSSYT